MSRNNGRRVLAIGIDAAEPALIRRLIDQNEMPALKSLQSDGRWMRVQSPAHIGSGSVWPTFASGEEPVAHGIHGEWCWQPETMSLKPYDRGEFQPFWKALSDKGISVGVLDPPFARPVGLSRGFEIVNWGTHDPPGHRVQAQPAAIADFVTQQCEPHPLSLNRHDNASADDPRELERLSSSCLRGVKLRGSLAHTLLMKTRPDFALIVFPEIHHSAHHLWHTCDFDAEFHSDFNSRDAKPLKPSLQEICREVDRQIESLLQTMADNDAVIVFSLHGMRPAAGVPSFLPQLLCEKGFTRLASWKTQSWPERGRSLLAGVKRRAPSSVKKLYYRTLSCNATKYLAQPNMMPVYDWRRTRAFSLPSDQHGWIRINLQGRERLGIVTPQQYKDTCEQLEALMRSLQLEDGKPLVLDVVHTTPNSGEAGLSKLPDLVVHWASAAFVDAASIKDSTVLIRTISHKFTGQHAPDGFCILKGRSELVQNETLRAKDMHLLIAGLLS